MVRNNFSPFQKCLQNMLWQNRRTMTSLMSSEWSHRWSSGGLVDLWYYQQFSDQLIAAAYWTLHITPCWLQIICKCAKYVPTTLTVARQRCASWASLLSLQRSRWWTGHSPRRLHLLQHCSTAADGCGDLQHWELQSEWWLLLADTSDTA